jgi:methionyl-tRNA synthetase
MNYFVTTSIPYVNGEPHIGFGMELVQADVLARAARQQGKPVIFTTGTDEHGSKVAEKAAELKIEPKEFADKISKKFRDLHKLLDISNDRFVRTTDSGHEQRAQIIWKNLEKDIYKSQYIGLYCVGCESFVTEAVAKENNNICPHHNTQYQKIEEENYFFKLSKYTEQIEKAIVSGSFQVIPAAKKHEILQVIKGGLEDISISRPKEKISWGIPVPGDKTQVMYVWFEALMNYITVLGYPEHEDFKNFWPANVQVVGKDILRFHAAIWPGMLLGLGLPLPKTLYAHGFVTIGGEKISKSLGNVIHPKEIVDKYGTDAFRYFFLRHIPSYEDGTFTWELLGNSYNNELANELGNAVQRTVVMIQKYQNGIIGVVPPAEHDVSQYADALDKCKFDRALDEVWEQVRGLNQYIDEEKPWTLAKNKEDDHLRAAKIKNIFESGVIKAAETTLFPKQIETPVEAV